MDRFLAGVAHAGRREDSRELVALMSDITGDKPAMWGDSLVGFGKYHYVYESGREGEFFLTGFSPRKQHLVVYVMAGFERFPALMKKLGKYKTGSSCLYLTRLDNVDRKVLRQLIRHSVTHLEKTYGRCG